VVSQKVLQIINLGWARFARVLAKYIKAKILVVGAGTVFARSEHQMPEETSSLFQPDVLLPIQFYETLRRKHVLEREKLLMFAVLEDAVEGFMRNLNSSTRKGQRRFREAEEWINRRDKLWLYSFDNVCEALDIDPDYMRRGLNAWKKAQLERIEHAVHTPMSPTAC
jgi:hypothetical protein